MNFFSLTTFDLLAMIVFFASMFYFNLRVERETIDRPSTFSIMSGYRRKWMEIMTTRDNRIVDAQIMSILQQSARFFASGMMIAIGGVLALLARPELMAELSEIFHREIPQTSWSLRLFFTALILANGFLKFLWASRLFGYASIVIGAVPEGSNPETLEAASRAASIIVTASRSFNRGLRLIYFAMASLCWLIGAVPFIIATIVVSVTIWRREFNSQSRAALLVRDHE